MRLRKRKTTEEKEEDNNLNYLEDFIRSNSLNELENELKKEKISKNINNLILSSSGNSLLHLASQLGQNKVIELLLLYGSQINLLNSNKETSLDLAYLFNQQKTSIYLIEKGGNYTLKETTKEVYYSGDVYTTTKNIGRTLLHWSAKLNSTLSINYLLDDNDKNLNIDIQNDSGSTALHQAFSYGSEDAILLLIKRGASISIRDYKGNTPFDKCKGGKDGLLSQKLRKFYFAFHEAIKSSNLDEIQLLLLQDNSIYPKYDENGYTQFQYALILDNIPACNLFLFGKIDNITFSNLSDIELQRIDHYLTTCSQSFGDYSPGLSPINICCRKNLPKMIEYLLNIIYQLPDKYINKYASPEILHQALQTAGLARSFESLVTLASFGADIYHRSFNFINYPLGTLYHLEYGQPFSLENQNKLIKAYENSTKLINWIRRRSFVKFLYYSGLHTRNSSTSTLTSTSTLSSTSSSLTTTLTTTTTPSISSTGDHNNKFNNNNNQFIRNKLSPCEIVFGIDLCVINITRFI